MTIQALGGTPQGALIEPTAQPLNRRCLLVPKQGMVQARACRFVFMRENFTQLDTPYPFVDGAMEQQINSAPDIARRRSSSASWLSHEFLTDLTGRISMQLSCSRTHRWRGF